MAVPHHVISIWLSDKQYFPTLPLQHCLRWPTVAISRLVSTSNIIQNVFMVNEEKSYKWMDAADQMTPELSLKLCSTTWPRYITENQGSWLWQPCSKISEKALACLLVALIRYGSRKLFSCLEQSPSLSKIVQLWSNIWNLSDDLELV